MTPPMVCLIGCLIAVGMHASDAVTQSTHTRADIEQSLSEALAAYEAGNTAAVADWMASPIGARTVVSSGEIGRIVLARTEPWSRSTAAFLLEVAAAIASRQPFRAPGIIDAGRTYLLNRPEAPGKDAAGDRFEWLWHQAAIAVTQDIRQYAIQQAYLDAIAPRLDVAMRHGVALPARLPLARAIAAAGLCCWTNVPGAPIQFIRPPVRSSLTLRDALVRFEQAAEIPALRVEALIRGAVLLHKSGRAADALAWFDRIPPHTDAELAYAQHLTRGRVLDAAGRPADAAAAYREALAAAPASQSAGIGLAAALLRAGRSDEAGVAAAAARTMPEGPFARLSTFERADARFLPQWLAEMRRLR